MRKDCHKKGKAQGPAKGIKGGGKGFNGGYGAQSAGKGVREVHWSGQDQIAVCLGESARDLHEVTMHEPRAKPVLGDFVVTKAQKKNKSMKNKVDVIN